MRKGSTTMAGHRKPFEPRVRLSYLEEGAKRRLIDGSLRVLEEVGGLVQHDGALTLLHQAGCACRADGLVRIPRLVVERAISTVPASIILHDRTGEPALQLGGYNTYFGTGSDLMWQYDPETGERRVSTLDDVARVSRLCEALPGMDFVMSGAYPTELPPKGAYLATFTSMMSNCTKPLVIVAENEVDLGAVVDVAEELRGGGDELRVRPYLLVYVEPVSPLTHPRDSMAKLLLCAERGVPVAYVPGHLAGATGPISNAGHIVQGMAECLLGLVVHQLAAPGAPFMFGVNQATLDMVSGQCSYTSVECFMNFVAAVEMGKWLGLPNWGIAGCTDSQAIDMQMGLEAGELTLLAMLTGSNLNHDVGFLGFGLTGSLEEIVITDEFISLNRKLLGGFGVGDEDLAVDVIASVGPQGHYLGNAHTRAQLRSGMGQWRPTLLNRDTHERWLERGAPDLGETARRKVVEILAGPPVPAVASGVLATAEQRLADLRGAAT